LLELRERYSADLSAIIDGCLEGLGEEFYLPRSTAATYLQLAPRAPPTPHL
jgi:hypothetical protein